MTPHPQARRRRLAGRLPDGREVTEEAGVFSRGARVYQATLVGHRIDDAVSRTFFDALRVLP